ncbi:uncharacterized protein N7498_007897 [Penicillium cinerascens]|uniref:ADP-ribosylation factor n=1 Tax=Penicillium cinerascens TaxID=70096 RepID=A0A9W9JPV6_9EURO|nr:uncharacterized protein N7498_007897 [Penicillium cinerascens]KAJ5198780.1 hypothetical protein N7498_007897 [Penicillium cinerascens]
MADTLLLNPQEYYYSLSGDSPSLKEKFHDIDDKTHFYNAMNRLEDPHTRNFVLDFGNEDAWSGADLDTEELKLLLSRPRARCFGTRWINIWAPEEQKDTIKALTTHYGVSERLQGMMCTEPVVALPKPVALPKRRHTRDFDHSEKPTGDVKNAISPKDQSDPDTLRDTASFKNLTFSQVTDQIWHFSSVDHGPRYTCVGYNTLFVVPHVNMPNGKDLPDGRRLWSWLILCEDGTVISIQEKPSLRAQTQESMEDMKRVLEIVRRNVRFVFAGVSRQYLAITESDSLVTIRVRHFNDFGSDQSNIKQEDGPSLLFYYIFDDWMSSYGIIAKREHKYGVALDQMRGNMLKQPEVDLVDELHWLGRRLAVLKRLYQSYGLIMRRLLQRQRMLRDELCQVHPPPLSYGATFGDIEFPDLRQANLVSNPSQPGANDKPVGVHLSSAAVARFERLADRINLYCLSEIDSCLTEKESLTFVNLNLIALKDSQAVEKLTRITILLAKATIMFLPVSLMTGYFSTQLQGIKGGKYSVTEYWVAFAVILVVSILLLMIFGVASDTVEGKTIYRSLVRTFFRTSRERMQQRRGG